MKYIIIAMFFSTVVLAFAVDVSSAAKKKKDYCVPCIASLSCMRCY
jgi:hypothetical protein